MPTFIVDNDSAMTQPIRLSGEDARHLTRVMRGKMGETVRVTNNAGRFALCRIISLKPIALEKISIGDGAPPLPIIVCLPLIAPGRVEWAVEKLTELNIAGVQLTVTERTQQRAISPAKLARLKKTAMTAQKQCGRCWPLKIAGPTSLTEILADPGVYGVVASLSCSPDIGTSAHRHRRASTHIFIGPEGGWSAIEQKLFQDKGILSANLGPTVLRTETAAIALAVRVLRGDFR